MSELLTGGCQCGKVRYEAHAENPRTVICACLDCQKAGGAVLNHAVGVKRETFNITQGKEYLKNYASMGDSGREVKRFFCVECGSPLFGQPESYPDFLSVRVPTLDAPIDAVPAFAIYQKNIPDWIQLPKEVLEKGKKLGG